LSSSWGGHVGFELDNIGSGGKRWKGERRIEKKGRTKIARKKSLQRNCPMGPLAGLSTIKFFQPKHLKEGVTASRSGGKSGGVSAKLETMLQSMGTLRWCIKKGRIAACLC